jgi:hypothetical protein
MSECLRTRARAADAGPLAGGRLGRARRADRPRARAARSRARAGAAATRRRRRRRQLDARRCSGRGQAWYPRRARRSLLVDEEDAVADEPLVFDPYAVANEGVALDLAEAPISTPRWISTNGPTRVPSPIRQPYMFVNESTTTSSPNSASRIRRYGASLLGASAMRAV